MLIVLKFARVHAWRVRFLRALRVLRRNSLTGLALRVTVARRNPDRDHKSSLCEILL